MTFLSAVTLKIIGGLATAVFTFIIGKRVFVIHKTSGFWNIGKTLVVREMGISTILIFFMDASIP